MLTSATEYACLALLAIAATEDGYCKRDEITARYDIPPAYLEQILRKMTMAGFLVSRRGAGGGFQLARSSADILIADVVRAIDGPLAPVRSVSENFYHPSPLEASPGFHELFRKVRDAVAGILESTTLEDIVARERHAAQAAIPRRGAGARTASPRRPRD